MSDEHVDQPQKLTHLDDQGRITMVDVGTKTVSARTAEARGQVLLSPQTIAAIRERRTPKGDPLETARLAAIMAAKKTRSYPRRCPNRTDW
jgi:cyclic pyranopterin phosphate synthase